MSWLQLWAWLPTADDVAAYRANLDAYAQAKGLRIEPGTQQVALWPLMEWLDRLGLVPERARMQLRLSLILLGVCIVNAAALLSFSLGRRRRSSRYDVHWERDVGTCSSSSCGNPSRREPQAVCSLSSPTRWESGWLLRETFCPAR